MNTKDARPIEIVPASNGLIVRPSIDGAHMATAMSDVMVFDDKNDLFAFLEGYFIKEDK